MTQLQPILPTVGRKVWYRPGRNDQSGPKPMVTSGNQPLDATIIAVWGERLVNLLVTDVQGQQFPVLSCTLLQPGDPLPAIPMKDGVFTDEKPGRYAEWMPYQVSQAQPVTPAPEVETKTYADGTVATGAAPLPDQSPAEQAASEPATITQ